MHLCKNRPLTPLRPLTPAPAFKENSTCGIEVVASEVSDNE